MFGKTVNMKLRGEYNVKSEEDRVKLIADLVEEGSQDPYIRELTLKILDSYNVREKDHLGEINAIFDWIKNNIKYRGDVFCRDSYHTARRIVELKSADCDDYTILAGSMLASIGYPVGARIISTKPNIPYHHIYPLVGVPKRGSALGMIDYKNMDWIPLDPTIKSFKLGQEARWVKKRDFIFICDRFS